jgi:PKD repeat protein
MNGPRSTFRAILHETSNLVELHYPSLIREVRLDAMKAAISGGPNNFIISASGDQLFALSGTSICFTPTGSSSYEETREPCPVLAPPNTAPVAVVGGPFTVDEGSPLLFDGTTSWDADQDALTYAWTFGDGTSSAEGLVSHAYVDDGEFAVTLTVADPQGLTAEASTTAHVRNVSPAVTLAMPPMLMLAGGPTPFATILSGETAELSAVFADPGVGDAPWKWSVDWGATIGAIDEGTSLDQSAPIVARRRVLASGTHTVTLVVEDKDGGRSTVFGTLVVNRVGLDLDVRPGEDNDTVNTSSNGRIWIAILGSTSFDVRSVVVESVRLGSASVVRKGRGVPMAKLEDADGDGDIDLWLQFETQALVKALSLTASTASTESTESTASLEIRATLTDGVEASGTSEVTIVH